MVSALVEIVNVVEEGESVWEVLISMSVLAP